MTGTKLALDIRLQLLSSVDQHLNTYSQICISEFFHWIDSSKHAVFVDGLNICLKHNFTY
jgi:hypothetical protein